MTRTQAAQRDDARQERARLNARLLGLLALGFYIGFILWNFAKGLIAPA